MQGDLFATAGLAASPPAELTLDADQLRAWQQRLHHHQAPLFRGAPQSTNQTNLFGACLLYTSPSPRDLSTSRMPSSA